MVSSKGIDSFRQDFEEEKHPEDDKTEKTKDSKDDEFNQISSSKT